MRVLFVVALAALPRGLVAQKRAAPLSAAESTTYVQLRARVLEGDTAADYTTLRLLYARIPDEGKPSAGSAFQRARTATDSAVVRATLDTILFAYVGHVRAHRDVGKLYEMRGDSTGARREEAIVRAFVRSIANTDGLTPETAMLVTNIAEEYAVMEARGVTQRFSQALVKERTSRGDEAFDVLTGPDSSGKMIVLYFRLNWW